LPLLNELLASGQLVAPFRGRAATRRGYYPQLAPRAAANPDAKAFIDWLVSEAEQVRSGEPGRISAAQAQRLKRSA
jgi:DNA-binding transcriptional LysR family regulator